MGLTKQRQIRMKQKEKRKKRRNRITKKGQNVGEYFYSGYYIKLGE
ncbi:MAG: hypothetical protein KBB52_01925 [Candidatus Omnitrophica bacterium]|nr:hypothetical protein [Candidatus Omnitrophota bacterium]